jgi:acetyl esterase/lipase
MATPQHLPGLGLGLLVLLGVVAGGGATPAAAQPRVERNVPYGMYSGLALLLDVHVPEAQNGAGVLFVPGSAWTAPLGYAAVPLKETQIQDWAPDLLRAGYTIFVINHRATPRFTHPGPIEDVQRATRFIRHHAARFGIDPARLGAIGGSSGGHLVALAAMLGAPGIAGDPDPVNREPATLRAIVLRAAPTDLNAMIGASTLGTAAVVALVGRLPPAGDDDRQAFRSASPIAHVSPSAPPTLLLHGDADDIVPFRQSVAMAAALKDANVPVSLVRIAGGGHGSTFVMNGPPHPRFQDALRETTAWLDRYLGAAAGHRRPEIRQP